MSVTYHKATLSFIDKTTWYIYLGAEAEADRRATAYGEIREERDSVFKQLDWRTKSDIASADMSEQLKHNVGNVFKNYLANILENSTTGNGVIKAISKTQQGRLYYVVFGLYLVSVAQEIFYIVLVLLMGVWVLVRWKSADLVDAFLLLCCAYLIITSGISFWQGDRFFIVFFPLTFTQ